MNRINNKGTNSRPQGIINGTIWGNDMGPTTAKGYDRQRAKGVSRPEITGDGITVSRKEEPSSLQHQPSLAVVPLGAQLRWVHQQVHQRLNVGLVRDGVLKRHPRSVE